MDQFRVSELWYHGLVDMSSPLELDDSIGIGGGGLGVFEGTPSLWGLDLQLNEWGPLLFGPRRDGGVLCHQLTATAPEQQRHHEKEIFYLHQTVERLSEADLPQSLGSGAFLNHR